MHTQPHGVSAPSEFPGLSAIRRAASAGPYTAQILAQVPPISISSLSLQAPEDGEKHADTSNGVAGVNFASQMRHFEHVQHQHRLHRVVDNDSRPPRRPPVVPEQVFMSIPDFQFFDIAFEIPSLSFTSVEYHT